MTPEEIANITGKSAFDVAVENGFKGTESEWLTSLKGQQGETGSQGLKGDKGDAGATGAQGMKGDKGDAGEVVKTEKSATLAPESWVQVAELWTYNIYDTGFKSDSIFRFWRDRYFTGIKEMYLKILWHFRHLMVSLLFLQSLHFSLLLLNQQM